MIGVDGAGFGERVVDDHEAASVPLRKSFAGCGDPGGCIIYRSSQPFSETAEAHQLNHDDTESAWIVNSGGITVICGRGTHSILLLGTDPTLVHRAAALLNAV